MTAELTFPYATDNRWIGLYKTLGLKGSDGVTLTDDGRLVATYGRFRVDTPVGNVVGWSASGPHRFWTAVGVRLSFTDDGLTFGTNHRRGLCIEFVERIPKVIGFKDHSALWVSVADVDGLAGALAEATA